MVTPAAFVVDKQVDTHFSFLERLLIFRYWLLYHLHQFSFSVLMLYFSSNISTVQFVTVPRWLESNQSNTVTTFENGVWNVLSGAANWKPQQKWRAQSMYCTVTSRHSWLSLKLPSTILLNFDITIVHLGLHWMRNWRSFCVLNKISTKSDVQNLILH